MRHALATQVVKGSLAQVASQSAITLEEAFMNAERMVLVDTSGSMAAHDAPGGRERIDVADDELKKIQAHYPGKVAVVSFSDEAIFCPGGVAERQFGGTRMDVALEYAEMADKAGLPVILISDGIPDSEADTLRVARRFKHKIDCIFIGRGDSPGQEFLRRLAAATGGTFSVTSAPAMLAAPVMKLLAGGK